MNDDQASPTAAAATADKRREDMIRAALDVIVERGYPDTRIADVAERAGTSPALVIYYFTTKDNLLTEAVRLAEDHWYDLGAARMAAIDSAAGRLEWIVAATCLPQADEELPEPWALWLDLWAQAVRHPEVARVRADFDARWRAHHRRGGGGGRGVGRVLPGRSHGVRHHALGTPRRVRRADRPRGRRSSVPRRPSPAP